MCFLICEENFILQMFKRRIFTTIAYYFEPQLPPLPQVISYEFKNVLVETQPPFCEVCKQYLTEFSCNSIRPTYCPYFEIESDKEKK